MTTERSNGMRGTGADGAERGDVELDVDELTTLALAADPTEAIDDGAEPWYPDGDRPRSSLLPEWYMPAPQAAGASPRRVLAAAVIIGSLLVVNGVGLCVTYGFPEIAW